VVTRALMLAVPMVAAACIAACMTRQPGDAREGSHAPPGEQRRKDPMHFKTFHRGWWCACA
jgi:hypothetical protein